MMKYLKIQKDNNIENPDSAWTMNLLASVYYVKMDFAKAFGLFEDSN